MQTLLDIINSIAKPDFMDKYNYINDIRNRYNPKYLAILKEWNLFDEISIVSNIDVLIKKSKTNRSLQRLINCNLFDNTGKYKTDRAMDILQML